MTCTWPSEQVTANLGFVKCRLALFHTQVHLTKELGPNAEIFKVSNVFLRNIWIPIPMRKLLLNSKAPLSLLNEVCAFWPKHLALRTFNHWPTVAVSDRLGRPAERICEQGKIRKRCQTERTCLGLVRWKSNRRSDRIQCTTPEVQGIKVER